MKPIHSSLLLLFFSLLLACSSEKESDLIEPEIDCSQQNFVVSIVSTTSPSCDEAGSVELSSSGGSGSVTYSLDGVIFQESATFTDLDAGTYTFTVKDAGDCTAQLEVTLAAEDSDLELSVTSVTTAGCNTSDGQVVLSATGGDGSYQYQEGDGSLESSNTFAGLAAGSYQFTVVDGKGCSATVSAEVITGVSLVDDVMPIITDNCAVSGCHGNSRSPLLNTKEQIIASASRIKARTGAGTMPPAGRQDLTQAQIDLIACWVDEGAQDN